MKKLIFLLSALNLVLLVNAQTYSYFSDRKGVIINSDGSSITVNNLTLMYWDMMMGNITALYGTSKLKCKEIEIDLKDVRSLEFLKESDGTDYTDFYVDVLLKSGTSGRFLIKRVYSRGPYFSFVGKNDFGTVAVKMWDVKKVLYED
jgi:hypothetical protein